MAFGSFGDLVWDSANTPTTMNIREANTLPRHPRLEGKALLQWTEWKLREIDLGMIVHFDHCDPEQIIGTWQQMLYSHEAYELVMPGGGNTFGVSLDVAGVTLLRASANGGRIGGSYYSGLGLYIGDYVVEDLKTEIRKTDKNGRIIWARIDAKLIECVAEDSTEGGFSLKALVTSIRRLF